MDYQSLDNVAFYFSFQAFSFGWSQGLFNFEVYDVIFILLLQILCRQKNMDDDTYNKLLEKATSEGYDVSKLEKTMHTNPPPETEEEGSKDDKGIWFINSLFGR